MGRQIFTTYTTVTPESAAEGDAADYGWFDEGLFVQEKPKYGFDCEVDEIDVEDNITPVIKAVDYMTGRGAYEASSSRFHRGVWYSSEPQVEDYRTGETLQYSFHLEGFSEEEQYQIYQMVTDKI